MQFRKSFVPRFEALEDRLTPSVTFIEDTATHLLTVNASWGQNNNITIVNNGDGDLTITADGTTRNFTNVTELRVNTYEGTDTVTYNQGTAASEVDIRRNFKLRVDLGDNLSGSMDRFTANVFGDVGFFNDGAWQARSLDFHVFGGGGADRIDINADADVDVRDRSSLRFDLHGDGGNDSITIDHDGRVDGTILLEAAGENDNDTVNVNLHLDTGSSGEVRGIANGPARVRGDLGDDILIFAVRLADNTTAGVDAEIDGGFNWGWPDNDVGRHTNNVRSAYLEQDFIIE